MEDESIYYRDAVLEILSKIGAIEFCRCGNLYREAGKLNKNEIYAIATAKLKELYPNMNNFKLFDGIIDNVMKEALIDEKCPYCEENDD